MVASPWSILRIALLWSALSGIAQGQDTLRSIVFEGLQRTRPEMLYRFLQSQIGDASDSLVQAEDAQRLQNLPFLNLVQPRLDSGGVLCFTVQEAWTRFPIANLGGVRGNFWAQLGYTDAHLMGRGIQLSAFAQLNNERLGGQLYMRAPNLGGSNWGATLSLLRWASTEPLFFGNETVFYDYDNSSAGATLLFDRNLEQTWELGATYFVDEFTKDERHEGLSTPGTEQARIPKLLFKASHRWGIVNQYDHQFQGWDLVQHAQAIRDLPNQSWFYIYWADARWFTRLGNSQRLNLALRLRAGLSTNTVSPFAPFVLDSHINLRGSGNRIDRGTGVLTANVELRHTLWQPWKLALQGVAFSDLGTWRQPGGELNDLVQPENVRHFVGAGLRLVLKPAHNAVLRADYGVDLFEPRQRGLVLGFGQYF
ncbi:MAG: BamA/TamA family outer membrane protein [Cryomorphaceae bacterium]|nr:BamA/TamA family outer membrane protein [Cryomorphaceae bacterium]